MSCRSALLRSLLTACVLAAPGAALADGQRVAFVFKGTSGFPADVLAQVQGVAAGLVAEEGNAAEDVTPVYAALFSRGLYPDFSAPPPDGWPQALAADWKEGNEACRLAAEHAARSREKATGPSACATQLASALWNRWLVTAGHARVVELSLVTAEAPSTSVTVVAVTFRPGQPQGKRVRAGAATSADVPRVAQQALGLILQELGDKVATALPSELPRAPAGAVARVPATESGKPSVADTK